MTGMTAQALKRAPRGDVDARIKSSMTKRRIRHCRLPDYTRG